MAKELIRESGLARQLHGQFVPRGAAEEHKAEQRNDERSHHPGCECLDPAQHSHHFCDHLHLA